ncbi:OB-fold domain-containing protein [Mycobacterium florentinum]|nr:OB-fold domain-containing protein [Mycobacterium florentinum]MCV7410621.1 OB-fold domain-containing protein [Mycobacterium florentinum]
MVHPSHELCPYCSCADLCPAPVSGDATVVAATVNHQQWIPELTEPYVVAVVSLDDAAHLRLATNIVDCAPNEVRIGMRVRVQFRRLDDVWIPVFGPTRDAPSAATIDEPMTLRPPTPSRRRFEHEVAITGLGKSEFARHAESPAADLVLSACRAAIGDAGLEPADIDGISAYPGRADLAAVEIGKLAGELGIDQAWHDGAHEVAGQTGAVIAGMLSVAAGFCRHVLCWTAVTTHTRPGLYTCSDTGRVSGEPQWYEPFGALSPANWIALAASQYQHRYGVSRQALGWVAISARRHAARNPDALYRSPLSMSDYLAARPISTPFGLYDCDVPCDGAIAVVVSSAATAADLRHPVVGVDAVGTRITEEQSWISGTLTHQPNLFGPAEHLWSRASVGRDDVDFANLYDGFTFNVLSWLEALGFCGLGEAGDFVLGGTRIGPGGLLPVNPHGGQLTAGRSNGFGQLHEAVVQLRGDAGARQIDRAQVGLVTSGGGIPANCMLLTRAS